MKKNFTRLLALLMTLAIVFSLAACGNDEGETTTAAEQTTMEEETTVEGETTTAAETTTLEGDTTAVDATTAVGETTTQAGKPTTPAQILAAYTEVMNYAKTAKPAHNRKEFQSLPKEDQNMDGFIIKTLLPIANTFMTQEKDAEVEDQKNGNDMKWFPVAKSSKGCLLTNVSAIKSATCDELANGNYKIVIILKDEHNPEPYMEGDTKATSNTGNMFQPLAKSEIDNTIINDSTVNKVVKDVKYDLKFFNCKAILEYNPKTKQIVTMEQYMSVFIDIQEGRVIGFKATGNAILYNTLKAWNFKY
jgi:hypothetical protein